MRSLQALDSPRGSRQPDNAAQTASGVPLPARQLQEERLRPLDLDDGEPPGVCPSDKQVGGASGNPSRRSGGVVAPSHVGVPSCGDVLSQAASTPCVAEVPVVCRPDGESPLVKAPSALRPRQASHGSSAPSRGSRPSTGSRPGESRPSTSSKDTGDPLTPANHEAQQAVPHSTRAALQEGREEELSGGADERHPMNWLGDVLKFVGIDPVGDIARAESSSHKQLAEHLCKLGFSRRQAAEATKRCSTVEAAVEWLHPTGTE